MSPSYPGINHYSSFYPERLPGRSVSELHSVPKRTPVVLPRIRWTIGTTDHFATRLLATRRRSRRPGSTDPGSPRSPRLSSSRSSGLTAAHPTRSPPGAPPAHHRHFRRCSAPHSVSHPAVSAAAPTAPLTPHIHPHCPDRQAVPTSNLSEISQSSSAITSNLSEISLDSCGGIACVLAAGASPSCGWLYPTNPPW